MRLIEFEKVADLLAKEYKIVVKEGKGWASNIKEKEIYYKKNDIYNLDEDNILGLLLHEIAHIHYTSETTLPTKNKELTAATLNMVEDIAIENIIGKDYPNAEEILKNTEAELLTALIQNLPKMENTSLHEKALLYAAAMFRGRGYRTSLENYEKIGKEINLLMEPERNNILNRKKTKDLLPLVQKIVELLIKEAGEPTEEEKKQMLRDSDEHTHANQGTGSNSKRQKGIETLGGKGWMNGSNLQVYPKYIDEITDQAKRVGKLLRTILKRNQAMEFEGRYRTGKLKTRRIIRIKTTKDRKPFSRKIKKSNQSYAFAIACDISGSMWNNYHTIQEGDYALSSLIMTAEALKISNTPRSLIIFATNAVKINPINKNHIRWPDIITSKNFNKANTGNTNIDKAINACTEELKKTKAERKIMIILTDGQSDKREAKEAYQEAKKNEIECIGITLGNNTMLNEIMTDKRSINIENIENKSKIGQAFIKILKETITKSP